MQVILLGVMGLGFFTVLSAVGAADLNQISTGQLAMRMLIGILIMVAGYIGLALWENRMFRKDGELMKKTNQVDLEKYQKKLKQAGINYIDISQLQGATSNEIETSINYIINRERIEREKYVTK